MPNVTQTSEKVTTIVKMLSDFNDNEATELVAAILDSHGLVLSPQIIINVNKVQKNVQETIEAVKEEVKDSVS